MEANFEGWATKAGIKCADGRTISPKAFSHMHGMKVPLFWKHGHKDAKNVLGHALLEARPEGVRVKGYFNDTEQGQNSRLLVEHGDIEALSIFANKLQEDDNGLVHSGQIIEVSLVPSGANKGALIDQVRVMHSDDPDDFTELEDTAIIHTGLPLDFISHSEPSDEDILAHADETVKDVFLAMSDEQKDAVYYMLSQALEMQGSAEHSETSDDDTEEDSEDSDDADSIEHSDQEGTTMSNVFDQTGNKGGEPDKVLKHEQLLEVFADAEKYGSLKNSFLAHAGEYGVGNLELLFPDARAIDATPEFIARRMEWVNVVLGGTKKLPFSRIKSLSADITYDEARAKGYIKGNLKKEEYFELSKRETGPTTIYKKQKLDRDDIIDVTTIDLVNWLWGEMRLMLDEEIARAILVGDGREVDDEDKINESKIRPIAHDVDFYAHKITVPAAVTGDVLVEFILRSKTHMRGGTGVPTMFTTQAILTDMLLVKDKMNRRLYNTKSDLTAVLGVKDIVPVEVMEDQGTDGGELMAILVNMADYAVGTDRGGDIARFDDFDIDYNQYKYLLEGRMSGALHRYKSALVFSREAGTKVTGDIFAGLTFNTTTGVLVVPTKTGVVYKVDGVVQTAGTKPAIAAGATIEVTAEPASGYYFEHNIDTDREFTRPVA